MKDIFDGEILDDEKYRLVIAIVERGFSGEVVSAAKLAGAKGAAIIQGKGVGKNKRQFFGFSIEPENEVVFMLVKAEIVLPIMKSIYGAVDYKSQARGLVFALPVSYVSGMTHSSVDDLDI